VSIERITHPVLRPAASPTGLRRAKTAVVQARRAEVRFTVRVEAEEIAVNDQWYRDRVLHFSASARRRSDRQLLAQESRT
jgi:hypothetical protein